MQAEESSLIEELQRVIEDEKRKFKAWKVGAVVVVVVVSLVVVDLFRSVPAKRRAWTACCFTYTCVCIHT